MIERVRKCIFIGISFYLCVCVQACMFVCVLSCHTWSSSYSIQWLAKSPTIWARPGKHSRISHHSGASKSNHSNLNGLSLTSNSYVHQRPPHLLSTNLYLCVLGLTPISRLVDCLVIRLLVDQDYFSRAVTNIYIYLYIRAHLSELIHCGGLA